MSKVGQISIDKLLSTVDLTLEDYAHGVDDCLAHASDKAGKSAEDELHRTSPASKNGGEYRKSWTYQEKEIRRGKNYRTEMVVYNEKHYRLTHLLEKSHRIVNKYGEYGKTKAQPHIAPAQKNAEALFMKVFKEEVGRIRV
jgi:hypothetical protein